MIGPRNHVSQQLHASKYRQNGESFDDYCVRYARTTADDETHFRSLLYGLRTQAILPAGRQQQAVGWPFMTTAFNCFVGGTIKDDLRHIGGALVDGMMTLRSGGGDGWDFSPIRPAGEPVRSLGSGAYARGPVPFMEMWNSMCNTIRSAGERKGAMMGVLRVDHPDILSFVRIKQNDKALTNFNISVGVTDEFMEAVEHDKLFALKFEGRTINTVRALDVWAVIMENNWDWAEPGVLFLDTINRMNPLGYCEVIAATNPCGEQPLPPNGACLLLSHNLVKYVVPSYARSARGGDGHSLAGGTEAGPGAYEVDYDRLAADVNTSVRACDNVFERTIYPLEAQKVEALAKRRMGVGLTGVANALEICGHRYGSPGYLAEQSKVLTTVRDTAYRTSIGMARTKGSFPMFDADGWIRSGFAQTLPDDIRDEIRKHGLRNGLLLSIAPTGTISMTADNVSSGIEPPPAIEQRRLVNFPDGQREVDFNDYAYEEYGIRCRTAEECTPMEHVAVLVEAQKFVDSSISKTINLRGARGGQLEPGEVSFQDFKEVYRETYRGGAKGCTTFNSNGKRAGIITDRSRQRPKHESGTGGQRTEEPQYELVVNEDHGSCYTDPRTGQRTCG